MTLEPWNKNPVQDSLDRVDMGIATPEDHAQIDAYVRREFQFKKEDLPEDGPPSTGMILVVWVGLWCLSVLATALCVKEIYDLLERTWTR